MRSGVSYLGDYLPERLRAGLADMRAIGCDEACEDPERAWARM